jgi:hypothetical protein
MSLIGTEPTFSYVRFTQPCMAHVQTEARAITSIATIEVKLYEARAGVPHLEIPILFANKPAEKGRHAHTDAVAWLWISERRAIGYWFR